MTHFQHRVLISFVIATPAFAMSLAAGAASEPSSPTGALAFEANEGQFAPGVDYLLRAPGYNLALSTEPVIELYTLENRQDSKPGAPNPGAAKRHGKRVKDLARIRMRYVGSQAPGSPEASEPIEAKTNYLIGDERSNWNTGVASFKQVRYGDIYPGIDVEYHLRKGAPEYDFRIEPGADPAQIAIRFEGIRSMHLDGAGHLVLETAKHRFEQRAPAAWQRIEGQPQPVEISYALDGNEVRFDLGEWDPEHQLVIDPVLEFSSYFGGSQNEFAHGTHVDAAGNIYSIGSTSSAGLATPGVFEENNPAIRTELVTLPFCPDCTDAGAGGQTVRATVDKSADALVISKFSTDGTQRLWTTYFRPADEETVFDGRLGINSSGVSDIGEVAFGLDNTLSGGLPLVNEIQSFNPDQENAYIAKLDDTGSDLIFATYLQLGSFSAIQRGLDVAPNGDVVAVGAVGQQNNFPQANALPTQDCVISGSSSSQTKGWIALWGSTGTLNFSTCIGGDNPEGSPIQWMRGVRYSDGKIYALGYSSMTDFPLVNEVQSAPGYSGSRDMVVVVVNPGTSPSTLEFSTYYGPSQAGSAVEANGSVRQRYFPIDIGVDSNGDIIVTGVTNEFYFPTVNPLQPNVKLPRTSYGVGSSFPSPLQDMFVTKINPVTPAIEFSTYLGGRNSEDGLHAISVDDNDNIYLATVTRSSDYPVAGAVQGTKNGETDLGLTKISPDGKLSWSTFFGGSDDNMVQTPGGVAVNPNNGDVVFTADTSSNDYPVLNPFQPDNAGASDVAISILDQSGDEDSDGDGVIDASDAFPSDAAEWRDTDGDGVGNVADSDDDGDGVDDGADAFPLDALWAADSDDDGIGDSSDEFPTDPAEAYDLDGDGTGDFADTDGDGDGVANEEDAFPADPNFSADNDFDGIPDPSDSDDDNDGTPDSSDPAPFDASVPLITFNLFDPFNTNLFKSPLPDGFTTPDGNVAWTAALGQSLSGDRSLGTRLVEDGETAAVTFIDEFDAGNLSFWYKVDSQAGSDIFSFSVDGQEQLSVSGTIDWTQFTHSFQPGVHTLEWRYAKDGSGSVGDDAAWIDDVDINSPELSDLSVAVENGQTAVLAGGEANYDIPVFNTSFGEAVGVELDVPVPPQYTGATWTCEPIAATATCPATSGSGPISATFDLPRSSGLLFRFSADIQTGPEEPVTVDAMLTIPGDFTDEDAGNNAASDTDFIGIFGAAFE